MNLIVRIFFAGLVAFVPGQDDQELTVLLPNAGQGYTLSDGTRMEPHHPLLVARAGGCEGDCGVGDSGIATILFADQPTARAQGALSDAIRMGAAWRLAGSELSISPQGSGGSLRIHRSLRQPPRGSPALPATPTEVKDFRWVADLGRIVPGSGVVGPALLSPEPPAQQITARLNLRSGEVWTYRLVRIGDEVPSLRFRTLQGQDVATDYSQALADWVVAEIEIPGKTVELVARPFGSGKSREVTLTPEDDEPGLVEIAILNVTASHFSMGSMGGEAASSGAEPGKHFEIYYDLPAQAPALRPVPHVVEGTGARWSALRGDGSHRSKLLAALRLGDAPHGVYDRVICPVAQLSEGPES